MNHMMKIIVVAVVKGVMVFDDMLHLVGHGAGIVGIHASRALHLPGPTQSVSFEEWSESLFLNHPRIVHDEPIITILPLWLHW